jgi:hypothetical protein
MAFIPPPRVLPIVVIGIEPVAAIRVDGAFEEFLQALGSDHPDRLADFFQLGLRPWVHLEPDELLDFRGAQLRRSHPPNLHPLDRLFHL